MTRWDRLPERLQPAPADASVTRAAREPSRYEEAFDGLLRLTGLDAGCEREYVFARPRRWRFDFAWPAPKVAVEIEGGVWADRRGSVGRHLTGAGFEGDCEKYNEAAIRGWLVLRLPAKLIESGEDLRLLERALAARRTTTQT